MEYIHGIHAWNTYMENMEYIHRIHTWSTYTRVCSIPSVYPPKIEAPVMFFFSGIRSMS